jgi:uncharacterized membrane protein
MGRNIYNINIYIYIYKCYVPLCNLSQFWNWMAIPNWNLHDGLLYSPAVEICRLYQFLGLSNSRNIYIYIYVTSQTRIGPIGDLDGLRDHPKHTIMEILVWDGNLIPEFPVLDKFRNGT